MSSVSVRVEPPAESQVVEVGFDGHEVLQPPPTPSEHLMRQASKIDFLDVLENGVADENASDMEEDNEKDEEEEEDEDEEGEKEEEEDEEDMDMDDEKSVAANNDETLAVNTTRAKSEAKSMVTQWPWENVRNKLRDALTELNVLSDVMSVSTKESGSKRYMVLDGPVKADLPDSRPYVAMLAKKKALDTPAKMLQQGAEHLRQLQTAPTSTTTPTTSATTTTTTTPSASSADFHFELLRLRQTWRLKKVSNTILGDLSYRSAGSRFKHSGVFEVLKSDEAIQLKVNIPAELRGVAYIQVRIQKESEQLMAFNIDQSGNKMTNDNPNYTTNIGSASQPNTNSKNVHSADNEQEDLHYQKRLEAAQNVLFCKELFTQLAKEAIQLEAPIPHLVVGNEITSSLFPSIQLIISLCHSPSSLSSSKDEALTTASTSSSLQRDHSHVLEHSLHQLLRHQHNAKVQPDHTALSTAAVGISRKRRWAGPDAADRDTLLNMAEDRTLLEQIIGQAQHVVLRLRTMFVLDSLAKELKDPSITCHWATYSSPTRTSVKVSLLSSGYTVMRSLMVIHVAQRSITVICKDGRVMHFSHETQELRDFIHTQVAQQQVNSVQALAKCTGWNVLSLSNQLGQGSWGLSSGCLLSNGCSYLAVEHVPQGLTRVYVRKEDSEEKKWKEVMIDRLEGRNLLNKIEFLMAALSN